MKDGECPKRVFVKKFDYIENLSKVQLQLFRVRQGITLKSVIENQGIFFLGSDGRLSELINEIENCRY